MGQNQDNSFRADGIQVVERDSGIETESDRLRLANDAWEMVQNATKLPGAVTLTVPRETSPGAYAHMLGRVATTSWGPPEYAIVTPSLAGASDQSAAEACDRLQNFSDKNCLGFVFIEPTNPDAAPPQHFETVRQKMQELGLVIAYLELAEVTLSTIDGKPEVSSIGQDTPVLEVSSAR